MFCYPLPPLETDIPYWVSKASFYQHFDQQDFTCRDILDVVDAYLDDWFDFDAAGNRQFMIPPVSVKNGVSQFISGRHRTAVLLKFMKERQSQTCRKTGLEGQGSSVPSRSNVRSPEGRQIAGFVDDCFISVPRACHVLGKTSQIGSSDKEIIRGVLR